jgi:hypothetical protein
VAVRKVAAAKRSTFCIGEANRRSGSAVHEGVPGDAGSGGDESAAAPECLDRIIPLGEAHLRHAIAKYMKHYHRERNHQGLDSQLVVAGTTANDNGRARRRERMAGLLSYYHREAA